MKEEKLRVLWMKKQCLSAVTTPPLRGKKGKKTKLLTTRVHKEEHEDYCLFKPLDLVASVPLCLLASELVTCSNV